jgi:phage gpG-like protein
MTIEDEINRWAREFTNKMARIDLSPLFPAIQQIARNSIIQNFRDGGRFGNDNAFGGGSTKWIQSARSRKQSGQTLRDKGLLMNSITVQCSQAGGELVIKVGSNMPYARVHQYGINQSVTVKGHTRMRRKTAKGSVYAVGKNGKKLKQKIDILFHLQYMEYLYN